MAKKKADKPTKTEKPKLFMGSSAEAVPLLNSVVELLQHQFWVEPWTAGTFKPSSNALRDLVQQAEKSSYCVFIFSKDDTVTVRGKKFEATRDNVIFELGLFMGKLGPEHCFILVPKDRKKLKIPSDLEGFSLVQYEDDRLDDSPKAAFAAACAAITGAANRLDKEAKGVVGPTTSTALTITPVAATPTSGTVGVSRLLQDLLEMIHSGAAGLEVIQRDQAKFTRWARNVLHMALATLKSAGRKPPDDAYVAWLKATDDGSSIAFHLGENTPADFAADHHPFASGEGLAGTVWEEGRPATHSPTKPHSEWKLRADCKNESYACVPVGGPKGPGGVLGFGTNEAFETGDEHIAVMEAFAALLAAATPSVKK